MLYLTQRVTDDRPATASVTLPLDVRIKSRIKVTLNDGRDAGLMLERGQLIRGGDKLSDDSGDEIVAVIAADETLSVAHCHDPFLLAKACYHLGNRHVPLQILPDSVSYQHDHVLDDMLRGLGLQVAVASQPFEPEAGAYQSQPHSHGHSHEHDHHHAHAHSHHHHD